MGKLIISLSCYLSLINCSFPFFCSYNYFLNDHCLQQAYFKCAYECFDRRRDHDEISNCVENCSVPVVRSQQMVENEMAKFQVSYFPFIFRHSYFYSVSLIDSVRFRAIYFLTKFDVREKKKLMQRNLFIGYVAEKNMILSTIFFLLKDA
jgi:hypothetical protein